ncbi:uncharacterized protein BJ171DRAFT_255374 [Polychytrium aggregatum]|uniref:uncharacterized protein n=1 Tax=Polychytrium aggregatum TaxID=110093 RepID=UPI0022FEDB26|nr:uncharacterized protein BJ171DRAFT_255374 [Polychytrium aggregatum]KAI9207796.1 hypothetical protein BJ171DRAFT_255374 [Polychytrium aggregatum]
MAANASAGRSALSDPQLPAESEGPSSIELRPTASPSVSPVVFPPGLIRPGQAMAQPFLHANPSNPDPADCPSPVDYADAVDPAFAPAAAAPGGPSDQQPSSKRRIRNIFASFYTPSSGGVSSGARLAEAPAPPTDPVPSSAKTERFPANMYNYLFRNANSSSSQSSDSAMDPSESDEYSEDPDPKGYQSDFGSYMQPRFSPTFARQAQSETEYDDDDDEDDDDEDDDEDHDEDEYDEDDEPAYASADSGATFPYDIHNNVFAAESSGANLNAMLSHKRQWPSFASIFGLDPFHYKIPRNSVESMDVSSMPVSPVEEGGLGLALTAAPTAAAAAGTPELAELPGPPQVAGQSAIAETSGQPEVPMSPESTDSTPRASRHPTVAPLDLPQPVFDEPKSGTRPSKIPTHLKVDTMTSPEPINHHFFDFLKGDLIVLGGFYGSFLKNKHTEHRSWLTMEAVLSWGAPGIKLPLSFDEVENDAHVPSGILDRFGPLNVCVELLRELRGWESRSKGTFRLHTFAYDWRREGQYASKQLEKFMENIYEKNGRQPIMVVAHSMGGLITLSTVNRRPELFRGCVFAGTPFHGVHPILWAFHRGAPLMINKKILSAELHFSLRSSFLFLPKDGRGLVNDKDDDIIIDYFNPNKWWEYRLAHTVRKADSFTAISPYLSDALRMAKEFHESLRFQKELASRYPNFVLMISDRFPTATRFKASVKTRKRTPGQQEIFISRPCKFDGGDGVVSRESASRMPHGYSYAIVECGTSHVGIMNDLPAMRRSLKKAYAGESVWSDLDSPRQPSSTFSNFQAFLMHSSHKRTNSRETKAPTDEDRPATPSRHHHHISVGSTAVAKKAFKAKVRKARSLDLGFRIRKSSKNLEIPQLIPPPSNPSEVRDKPFFKRRQKKRTADSGVPRPDGHFDTGAIAALSSPECAPSGPSLAPSAHLEFGHPPYPPISGSDTDYQDYTDNDDADTDDQQDKYGPERGPRRSGGRSSGPRLLASVGGNASTGSGPGPNEQPRSTRSFLRFGGPPQQPSGGDPVPTVVTPGGPQQVQLDDSRTDDELEPLSAHPNAPQSSWNRLKSLVNTKARFKSSKRRDGAQRRTSEPLDSENPQSELPEQ